VIQDHHPLIEWTEAGLFCRAGGFHIDPHRPVELAVLTHAHSDHARRGSRKYFSTTSGAGLVRVRLGKSIDLTTLRYGESISFGDVRVSLHPAGHILGSAQVRVECGGEVWVASGDYKRDADPSCEPFEVVACDTFITEATFGTPKYAWKKTVQHGHDIWNWWQANAQKGHNSVLFGYSLGKTQRILAELAAHADRPILLHDSMIELTQCYREQGRTLAPTSRLSDTLLEGDLILAPPSALRDDLLARLGTFKTAFASGWMQGQREGAPYRGGQGYDHGFVMSDHADWADLNRTIDETTARRVFVLHRSQGALVRHLRKRGIDAHSYEALRPENFSRLPGQNLELFS